MTQVKDSLVVDAPAERVFAVLDDPDELERLVPRLRLERLGAPDRGLGARFKATVTLAPGGVVRVEDTAEVVDHYHPERFGLAIDEGNLSWTWTLGRVGDRTLVELRHTFSLPGGPVGRLVGNALSLVAAREVSRSLRALAETVSVGA